MEESRVWKMVGFGFRVLFLCFAVCFVSTLLHHHFPSIPLLGFIAQTLQYGAVAYLYCLAAGILGLFLAGFVFMHFMDEEKAFLVSFVIVLYILIRLEVFR